MKFNNEETFFRQFLTKKSGQKIGSNRVKLTKKSGQTGIGSNCATEDTAAPPPSFSLAPKAALNHAGGHVTGHVHVQQNLPA